MMSNYRIDVQVDPDLAARVALDTLVRIVAATLGYGQQPPDTEMTLVITDDAHIRELNRVFRDVDSPTDVLSFPARENAVCCETPEGTGAEQVDDSQSAWDFVTPDDLPPYLGDVIISYPTAVAQATEQGHAVEDELALLVVHGCLHLLGYDHATEEERQRMWTSQEQILHSLR
jgi:probable rRNA maturation factor